MPSFYFYLAPLILAGAGGRSNKPGNSEKEVPESSNKSESETAHQRYLGKGKAAVTDSSSPQQYQGVHIDPRRRLEFDVDSLLTQVSDLIIQADGGRSKAHDLTPTPMVQETNPLTSHPKSVVPDPKAARPNPRHQYTMR